MPQNVILRVDDDPVFTRFTEKILTEGGMKVIPAFNKAEGLAKFEEHHPSCVILDIFVGTKHGSKALLYRIMACGPNQD